MRDGEERSNEWKVVRYVRRRQDAVAIALPRYILLTPYLVVSLLAFA